MPDASALVHEARAALDGIAPGPWEAATAPADGSDETPAEYVTATLRPDSTVLYVVSAPSPDPERWAYLLPAITGDGPTSRANAAFIAAAPDLVRRMAAALDESELARVTQASAPLPYAAAQLRDVARRVVSALGKSTDDPDRQQAAAAVREVFDVAERIAALDEADVVWVTHSDIMGRAAFVAPLNVSGLLRSQVFAETPTVLTSAT